MEKEKKMTSSHEKKMLQSSVIYQFIVHLKILNKKISSILYLFLQKLVRIFYSSNIDQLNSTAANHKSTCIITNNNYIAKNSF